jgi:hydrogenase maturation factor HypF (carbamoyltransferase family)
LKARRRWNWNLRWTAIETDEHYNLSLVTRHSSLVLDWQPMIEAILADVKNGVSAVQNFRKVSQCARRSRCLGRKTSFGLNRVALSGGCFQNRYLTERTCAACARKIPAVLAPARADKRRRALPWARCCRTSLRNRKSKS